VNKPSFYFPVTFIEYANSYMIGPENYCAISGCSLMFSETLLDQRIITGHYESNYNSRSCANVTLYVLVRVGFERGRGKRKLSRAKGVHKGVWRTAGQGGTVRDSSK
jgi:hypothetical protein